MSLEKLEKVIKYQFKTLSLLRQAVSHPSYAHEKQCKDNQRLEFFGDAVLGLVIAELLYKKFPLKQEGELSAMRSILVNRQALATIAREYKMGAYLLLGGGEKQSGGADRDSNLEDMVEAIFGAVFLDGGYLEAKKVIRRIYFSRLKEIGTVKEIQNFKGVLQEYVQQKFNCVPKYRVVKEQGAEHEKIFIVNVNVMDQYQEEGRGRSKKDAQQAAAQRLLDKLEGVS